MGDAASCVSLAKVDVPETQQDEVLVEMILRPIVPADIRSVQGLFAGFQPEKLPAVPGIEGVGRLASPCHDLDIGQRVVSTAWPLLRGQGTWQNFCMSHKEHLYPVPDSISDQQAATFWSNPVTAVGLLETVAVPAGEWLLQTAASSNIGRQIIQISKDYGIRTINVVRRSSQREKLMQLGADAVVSVDEEDLGEAVKRVTGRQGAYACLDAVGGQQCQTLMQSLRTGGTLVVYSGLSGPTLSAHIKDLVYSSKTIKGFRMTPWFMSHSSSGRRRIVKEVFRLMEHVLQQPPAVIYPMERVADALQAAQNPSGDERVFLS